MQRMVRLTRIISGRVGNRVVNFIKMKKYIVLIILLQLVSCEKDKYCSDVIRGKPDHLISEQDLNTVKSLFKSNYLSLDNFQVYLLQKDELGHRHVRCFQYVNDLNIFSDDVIFHFDNTGHYYFLSGDIISGIDIDPLPKLDREAVVQLFLKSVEDDGHYSYKLKDLEDRCFSCELGYWDLNAGISYTDPDFRLAWRVRQEGQAYPVAIINDTENKLICYDNGIRY
jgi:hypothetical protein